MTLQMPPAIQSDPPWLRENLLTKGIAIAKIPGLYLSEHHEMPQAQQKLAEDTKEKYDHDEIFGDFVNVNTYINCPVDIAYEYCANVFSLEEWTFSVRDLKHVDKGLYVGREALAPQTVIYVRSEAYPDSRVIDYLCAWDQGKELWMRYYCRFVDAMPTFNKAGCVLMWLNCRHPYYVRGEKSLPKAIADGQARLDRPWVGDIWRFFPAGHRIEAENLKRILEYRFAQRKKA